MLLDPVARFPTSIIVCHGSGVTRDEKLLEFNGKSMACLMVAEKRKKKKGNLEIF